MYINTQPLTRASNPCANWSYMFVQLLSALSAVNTRCLLVQPVSVNFSKSIQILAATSITKVVASVPCDPAEQSTLGLLLLFRLKDPEKTLPNLSRFLAGINALPDTCLLVISNDWCSLLMIGDQSLLQSISIIIRSLNQWLARNIIFHFVLRRVENLVV
jgi:hypothetical protein